MGIINKINCSINISIINCSRNHHSRNTRDNYGNNRPYRYEYVCNILCNFLSVLILIVNLNINSLFYIPEQRNVPTIKGGLIKMDIDVIYIKDVVMLKSLQMRMVLMLWLLVVSVEAG